MKLLDYAPDLLTEAGDPTILKIQQALKSRGYDLGTTGSNKDGVDGYYGPKTKSAIMAFQKDNGIQQTGFVGVKTAPVLGTPQMTPYRAPQTQPTAPPIVQNVAAIKKDVASKIASTAQDVASKTEPITQNVKSGISKLQSNVASAVSGVQSGIERFVRKISPNAFQMFFTRPLTERDFTRKHKAIIYKAIQNAIKRGQKKNFGTVNYEDYGGNIKDTFDNNVGASTKDMLMRSVTDPTFQVASTLGGFTYRLQPDGTYLVTDVYDFSKAKAYTVTKDEIKGMSYPDAIKYIKAKDNLSLYRAARELAYLEHPDTAPTAEKVNIKVSINPKEFGRLQMSDLVA